MSQSDGAAATTATTSQATREFDFNNQPGSAAETTVHDVVETAATAVQQEMEVAGAVAESSVQPVVQSAVVVSTESAVVQTTHGVAEAVVARQMDDTTTGVLEATVTAVQQMDDTATGVEATVTAVQQMDTATHAEDSTDGPELTVAGIQQT